MVNQDNKISTSPSEAKKVEEKFFMLLVDGQTTPQNKITTLPQATEMGAGLIKKTGKKVYILEAVSVLVPKAEYDTVKL